MDGIKEEVIYLPVAPPVNLLHNNEYAYYVTQVPSFSIFIYRHKNAYVTKSGVCFDSLTRLLPGSFMHVKRVRKDQQKIALLNFLFRRKYRLDKNKKYLVVHNQWSINGYYHWLIDSIPRLWSVLDELSELHLLLPYQAKNVRFIQDIITLLPALKVVYIPEKKVAFVRQLVLPSHLPGWGLFKPEYLRAFRSFVLQRISLHTNEDLIYISRRQASRRKIINEDSLTTRLKTLGFKTVVLENHSFIEQVEIFNKAKLVISIHGAALSNIIFMKAHTSVIEIIKKPVGEERYLMEYQKLASIFEISYYSLAADSDTAYASFDEANLIVNETELKEIVEKLIG